jgi:hypothetical protein
MPRQAPTVHWVRILIHPAGMHGLTGEWGQNEVEDGSIEPGAARLEEAIRPVLPPSDRPILRMRLSRMVIVRSLSERLWAVTHLSHH